MDALRLLSSHRGLKLFRRPLRDRRARSGCARVDHGSLARAGWTVITLCFVTGCAGGESFLTGGPTAGQMKTSLSHLQYENEQLKTEVARLKEESRSMEDRLVQEQIHNGDLTARLDDARNILRDRGVDSETLVGARTKGKRDADPDDEIARPRTLPAGRTSKKPRKPPAASIPGDLDNLPTASDDTEPQTGTISLKSPSSTPRRPAFADDSSRSASDDDDLRGNRSRRRPILSHPAAKASPINEPMSAG